MDDSPKSNWFADMLDRWHAAARPEGVLPDRYRYHCLACNDLGVERYIPHPESPEVSYARPCTHCDEGRIVLAVWLQPAKQGDKTSVPGPWFGMSGEEIVRIRLAPCAHDPLPTIHEEEGKVDG